MRPVAIDFWGSWLRQLLAGLAILLVVAVLSLIFLPALHGSFVSTCGPATAFRSRRLFLAIYLWLITLFQLVTGLLGLAPSWVELVSQCRRPSILHTPAHPELPAFLLC